MVELGNHRRRSLKQVEAEEAVKCRSRESVTHLLDAFLAAHVGRVGAGVREPLVAGRTLQKG